MIDPKELMLGSIISGNGMPGEVVHIDHDAITLWLFTTKEGMESGYYKQKCDLIPLSAEVLEACGFEKYSNDWHNETHRSFLIDQFSDGYAISEPCKIGAGILSLHQLQNLYFIITGHPLEIDLVKLKNALK